MDINLNLLVKLLTTPEGKVWDVLKFYFSDAEEIVIDPQNYVWIKQKDWKHKPTLISHMDTVNKKGPIPSRMDLAFETTASQPKFIKNSMELATRTMQIKTIKLAKTANKDISCLGADDRSGVWLITTAYINAKIKPNVIFTLGEEIGCIGATKFTKDVKDFQTKFMLEFDRRGNDAVFYDTNSKPFQDAVCKAFATTSSYGSSSDIRKFQAAYNLNAGNIGIGYDSEHTRNESQDVEYLVRQLFLTVKLLDDKKLINEIGAIKVEKRITPTYNFTSYRSYGYDYDSDFDCNKSRTVNQYGAISTITKLPEEVKKVNNWWEDESKYTKVTGKRLWIDMKQNLYRSKDFRIVPNNFIFLKKYDETYEWDPVKKEWD